MSRGRHGLSQAVPLFRLLPLSQRQAKGPLVDFKMELELARRKRPKMAFLASHAPAAERVELTHVLGNEDPRSRPLLSNSLIRFIMGTVWRPIWEVEIQ